MMEKGRAKSREEQCCQEHVWGGEYSDWSQTLWMRGRSPLLPSLSSQTLPWPCSPAQLHKPGCGSGGTSAASWDLLASCLPHLRSPLYLNPKAPAWPCSASSVLQPVPLSWQNKNKALYSVESDALRGGLHEIKPRAGLWEKGALYNVREIKMFICSLYN